MFNTLQGTADLVTKLESRRRRRRIILLELSDADTFSPEVSWRVKPSRVLPRLQPPLLCDDLIREGQVSRGSQLNSPDLVLSLSYSEEDWKF